MSENILPFQRRLLNIMEEMKAVNPKIRRFAVNMDTWRILHDIQDGFGVYTDKESNEFMYEETPIELDRTLLRHVEIRGLD